MKLLLAWEVSIWLFWFW